MNRSASAAYYPFQVMPRFLLGRQGEVYYIGGSDILPPPLETQREARILEKLGTPEEKDYLDRAQSQAGGLYSQKV